MKLAVNEFPDLDKLSEAAAREIVRIIDSAVSKKGGFSIVLSGGNTPRKLHSLLGTVYRENIPWKSVSVYFGDERFVPHTDDQSNYRMARETLLNLVPIPVENIHPIPTDFSAPAKAAEAYERELRREIPSRGHSFDLVLLGMGKEGHTASLFPDSPVLDEAERWVRAAKVPPLPHERVTMTFPILNRSDVVFFLVTGSDKKDALKAVLDGRTDFHAFPANGIKPPSGKLVWWIDSAASPADRQ